MSVYTDWLSNPYKQDAVFVVEVGAIKLSDGSAATFYFSDRGYVSQPSDTPSNQYYDARVQVALNFTRSIFNEGKLGGETFPGYGIIQLANADGGLDLLDNYSFDSQTVIVRHGQRTWPLSDMGVIFNGTAQGIEFNAGVIIFRLRDNQYLFNAPLQSLNFAGSGGWEGGTSYAGKKKPVCYGECYGIEPVYIDPANLRFVFADGPVEAVLGVFDAGVALTFSADYANQAALDAAVIPAGNYATCIAEGKMRLQTVPTGPVTMHVKGDKTGGTYVSSAADIANRIATNRVGLSAGEIDSSTFTALNAINNTPVHFYHALEPVTCREAIGKVIDAIGGYWGNSRNGKLIVGRFDLPTGSSLQTFTETEILSYEKLPMITPAFEFMLGYKQCYKVHDTNQVAGAATAANRDFFTNAYRFSTAYDLSILTKWPSAQSILKETAIVDATAAATERDRLFAIFKSKLDGYRFTLKALPFQRDIRDEITIKLNRYGLSSGKNFIITTMNEDARTDFIEVECYG